MSFRSHGACGVVPVRRVGFQAAGAAVAVALVTALAVSPANAAELVAPTAVQDTSTTAPVEDASGASGDAAAIAAAAADYAPGDAGAAVALAEAASAKDAVALDSSGAVSFDGASVAVADTGTTVLSLGDSTQIGIRAVGAGAVDLVDGAAVQTGVSPATDIVTRATVDGAQLVAVLGDESAGDTVPFALDLPENATLTPQADGSVTVTAPVTVEQPIAGETERIDQQITAIVGDADTAEELTPAQLAAIDAIAPAVTETVVETQQIATIETPWAVDADGTALPTSYTLEGTNLTQNIDTTNATYPITADPSWQWNGPAWGMKLARSETSRVRDYAAALSMCVLFTKKIAVKACGVFGGYIMAQANIAQGDKPKTCLFFTAAPIPGVIWRVTC